jgi:hypothetical protein
MFCVAIQDALGEVQKIYGPYKDTNECMALVNRMNGLRHSLKAWKFKIFPMLK